MDDTDLYNFFLDVLKFEPTDPVIGHLITNVMDIKKINGSTLSNFEALINYTK